MGQAQSVPQEPEPEPGRPPRPHPSHSQTPGPTPCMSSSPGRLCPLSRLFRRVTERLKCYSLRRRRPQARLVPGRSRGKVTDDNTNSWPQPPQRPCPISSKSLGTGEGSSRLGLGTRRKGRHWATESQVGAFSTGTTPGPRLRGSAGLAAFGRTRPALPVDRTVSRLTGFTPGQRLCVHHEVDGGTGSRLCCLWGRRLSFLYK